MTSDYANYKHQLESYEAIWGEKLTALRGFVTAVSNDWEAMRTKRALMRLDEIQMRIYGYLKKLDQSTSISEFIQYLPSDLQRVTNIGWKLLAGPTNDSVPRPRTSEEVITSSFFQRPEVAQLLQRTFEKVRKHIQTTLIPVDIMASVYVDLLFQTELREALRGALSPQ